MISAAQRSTGTSAAARPATNTRFIHFFVTLQIHFIILANIADRKGIKAEARGVEVQAVLVCLALPASPSLPRSTQLSHVTSSVPPRPATRNAF